MSEAGYALAGVLIGVATSALIALVTIARENRYRFVERKMILFTDLLLAAEGRYDAIYWQRLGQASAATRGIRVGDVELPVVGPGEPLERARSAILLVVDDGKLDAAADALRVAASDLGQHVYIAPALGELIPAPNPTGWAAAVATYQAAHDAFIGLAKRDLETERKSTWRRHIGLR